MTNESTSSPVSVPEGDAREIDRYDAGLLGDWGGGNVEWWQDYIRCELDRAHDFYAAALLSAESRGRPQTQAARDVLAERARQVSGEGYSPSHDDLHNDGEMAAAAGAYAMYASGRRDMVRSARGCPEGAYVPRGWPWDVPWWKPKDPRRDLVRAGALILAEIERLDRASPSSPEEG